MDNISSTSSKDTQEFLEQVERELLEEIVIHLENDTISPEEAQQLAKDFLALLPVNDTIELLQHLKELSGKYEEIRHLYVKFDHELSEENKDKNLMQIASHIKANDLDSAIHVAKEANNHE